ncbi:aspartate/glutamate racemase family protein [Pigmentiphaga soli]
MSQSAAAPRIALIHAVQVAMAPIEASFRRLWPEARRASLLDDALPADLQQAGAITPAISARIGGLADYAIAAGADAILYTCSAFGDAIEATAARVAVPVLKPNEAMFEAALGQGRRIGMLATFASAVASMEQEFEAMARQRGVDATLETICVPEALAAANRGDIALHNRLVAEAVPRLAHCDAVMLAHFSTSTALELAEQALGRAVLTAPDAAVENLKARVAR